MRYHQIPYGHGHSIAGVHSMRVEMTGVYKEHVVFSVDGVKVEVPRDVEHGDSGAALDVTQNFFIDGAKVSQTSALAEPDVKTAVEDYIVAEFSKSNVKYKITKRA